MIDKSTMTKFDDVFPHAKDIKPKNKRESIELAKRVATAIREERAKRIKDEQENNSTFGFFRSAY